jgi:4-amino-4-deoxy-L-arabinose transferase-like glycosyltransferase
MQPAPSISKRPPASTFVLLLLCVIFYGSFTLFTPALLDDADSVHAEVAREMLVRHDWVTLHANGIRYLEKAPLLYWSMAASMRIAQLLGHPSARCLAVAARIPLALTVLALAFTVEAFARRAFRSVHAGLYAALILLSSFGVFLFTRILLPDAMLCLWLTLGMYSFLLCEQPDQVIVILREAHSAESKDLRLFCYAFATCCAFGVLSKGLIGVVFPIAIVLFYLLLTRGWSGTAVRICQLHPLSSLAVFLAIAAPWHILIALANPAQGHPGGLTLVHGHLSVPLPTQGNVHGWLWFYFVNEQLLRYLNLRLPRDYDAVPLWLFWGLCLVWLMPWSVYIFKAVANAVHISVTQLSSHRTSANGATLFQLGASPQADTPTRMTRAEGPAYLLLVLWAVVPLIFFSFSTRQEYYVLPSLPPLAILIAGWLVLDEPQAEDPGTRQKVNDVRRANLRATAVLLALGAIFAAATVMFLLRTRAPAPNVELAQLLLLHPADYALSMGHILDLNAQALVFFRVPLALAALSLFLGPLCSFILRKKNRPHAATLTLSAGAFGFLLAAHLAMQTFAPVLSSQQLAAAIAPQLKGRPGKPPSLIVIHQEYEFASTLGFYLQRDDLHILKGRSSDLWYGSFFADAPAIFETQQSLAEKWPGQPRIYLWQDLGNQPSPLPALPGLVYVIARSGGKEIVSNKPNQP